MLLQKTFQPREKEKKIKDNKCGKTIQGMATKIKIVIEVKT